MTQQQFLNNKKDDAVIIQPVTKINKGRTDRIVKTLDKFRSRGLTIVADYLLVKSRKSRRTAITFSYGLEHLNGFKNKITKAIIFKPFCRYYNNSSRIIIIIIIKKSTLTLMSTKSLTDSCHICSIILSMVVTYRQQRCIYTRLLQGLIFSIMT